MQRQNLDGDKEAERDQLSSDVKVDGKRRRLARNGNNTTAIVQIIDATMVGRLQAGLRGSSRSLLARQGYHHIADDRIAFVWTDTSNILHRDPAVRRCRRRLWRPADTAPRCEATATPPSSRLPAVANSGLCFFTHL